jgi:8-oxo-dGTP pyrophosphatase MutT (NUDIX family)
VLLALRSRGTHEGGTWGTVGGAIEAGETPWDAAVREAGEEADGLPLGGAEAAGSHRYDCGCGWRYTTFPVRVPGGAAVIVRSGWENHELRWVPAGDVDRYRLHPGLARSWPALRKLVEAAALSERGGGTEAGPPGGLAHFRTLAPGRPGAASGSRLRRACRVQDAAGDPPPAAGSAGCPAGQRRTFRVLVSSLTKYTAFG